MASGNIFATFVPGRDDFIFPGKFGMRKADKSGHPVLVAPTGVRSKALAQAIADHTYGAGTGMTVTVIWSSDQVAGNAKLAISVARYQGNAAGFQHDANNFAAAKTATAAANGTAGRLNYTDIALSAAEADALAAGEEFLMLVERQGDDTATDTIAGEIYIHGVKVRDT